MHQLLPSQLSESCHVDLPKALMSTPHHLIVAPIHRKACRLRELRMADAHDVGRQTRDEVDHVEGSGLTILAHEHNSLTALNPRHRVITETLHPHGHDHIPGLLGHLLLGDRQHDLRWYHAAKCIKRHHLLPLMMWHVLISY
jgi:hypothetical protein